jgi:serine/threonine protein phosphatase PrpC
MVGSVTDAGGRDNNEDSILVQELPPHQGAGQPGYLLAVADGMGGHADGEVASKLAIDLVRDLFSRDQPADVALALKQAYRRANEAIYQQGGGDAESRHMGTTLVSAVVRGKYVTIANVGDSRAYLMRANRITQVTQDHSVVAEQVQQGRMREQDARKSNQRNMLTQALGTQPTLDKRMPAIYELALLPEDRLLLCTDGFYDVLTNDDYLQLMGGDDPAQAASGLTSLAKERQTDDNVSAIVLAVGASLATIQRQEIRREIAEARGDRGQSVLIPAVVLVIVIALIALGVYFYL